jgi:hypothetical protein
MTVECKDKGETWLEDHMVERVKALEAELRTAKDRKGRRSERTVRTLARKGPEKAAFISVRSRLVVKHGRGGFSEKPVTTSELLEMHRAQAGLCRYTKLPYEFGSSGPLDVVVDRLDPARGWTRENVVLCALFAAVARNGWPLSLVVPLWRFLPTKVEG